MTAQDGDDFLVVTGLLTHDLGQPQTVLHGVTDAIDLPARNAMQFIDLLDGRQHAAFGLFQYPIQLLRHDAEIRCHVLQFALGGGLPKPLTLELRFSVTQGVLQPVQLHAHEGCGKEQRQWHKTEHAQERGDHELAGQTDSGRDQDTVVQPL